MFFDISWPNKLNFSLRIFVEDLIEHNDVMFGGGLGSEGRRKGEPQRAIDSERPSPTRAPQPAGEERRVFSPPKMPLILEFLLRV